MARRLSIATGAVRSTATAGASAPLPKALASSAAGFAIQVGAFKDKASADGVVRSLKGRGFPAYTVAPGGGGLFTVRVGIYRDRAGAKELVFFDSPYSFKAAFAMSAVLLLIYLFAPTNTNPFIYFQF